MPKDICNRLWRLRQMLFAAKHRPMNTASNKMASRSNAPLTDGRRERSRSSRSKIIAAMLDLVGNGDVAPSAARVAEVAGVGLRSVFRHFDDMDSLYQEIDQELGINVALMLQMVTKADTWQERLKENLQVRCQLYDTITPFVISGQVHRHTSAMVEASFKRKVELERSVMEHILPKSIQEDTPRFEALLMLLSPEAWIRLRRDQGLSTEAAIAAIQVCIDAFIPPQKN
mgnify:CR=1 FL=1